MLEMIKSFPFYIDFIYSMPEIKIRKVNKIVIGGMGGSAIPGDILKNYLENEIRIPIFVVRDYNLPKLVDKKTLVFIISYSGNTEETISMFKEAKKRNCEIILITSDGKLEKQKIPKVLVPKNLLPRTALPYLFFPLLKILQDNKIIKNKNAEIKETVEILKNFNPKEAEKLAEKISNKLPIIYGPEIYRSVLYRWQNLLNENSKKLAHYNCFPEINHKEIESYYKNIKNAFAVFLIDKKINKRILKQIEIAKKIISKNVNIYELKIKGKSLLARMFYAIYFGDYLSYFLAKKRKINPLKTENIEKVKRSLRR